MPGTKRKLRLVVDWTVSLLFSRDTSELGQLGHPPVLDEHGTSAADATADANSGDAHAVHNSPARSC
jgi:NADH dehydrogenase